MKSRLTTHKGEEVFHIDLANYQLDHEGFIKELGAAETITCQQPDDSLLVLTDITGTVVSPEVMRFAKESSGRTMKHVRKTAVVGITGMQKFLLGAVSRFSGQRFSVFDDIEKAKDWLVGGK